MLNKINGMSICQKGFSLIELLVAMTISLVLLSGLVYIFTNFVRLNTDIVKTIRLHQELRGIMTIMVNDIRRAGYWNQARLTIGGNTVNRFAQVSVINGDCILYSYDEQQSDPDGIPGPDDYAGFKLVRHFIKVKTSGGSSNGNCNTGVWWTLNDDKAVRISRLRFKYINSTFPFMQGVMQLNVRRVEIILSGALSQAPDITYTLQDSVYIPNDEIIPVL